MRASWRGVSAEPGKRCAGCVGAASNPGRIPPPTRLVEGARGPRCTYTAARRLPATAPVTHAARIRPSCEMRKSSHRAAKARRPPTKDRPRTLCGASQPSASQPVPFGVPERSDLRACEPAACACEIAVRAGCQAAGASGQHSASRTENAASLACHLRFGTGRRARGDHVSKFEFRNMPCPTAPAGARPLQDAFPAWWRQGPASKRAEPDARRSRRTAPPMRSARDARMQNAVRPVGSPARCRVRESAGFHSFGQIAAAPCTGTGALRKVVAGRNGSENYYQVYGHPKYHRQPYRHD